jgi:RNA polymerase sigma-70 factor (ECF subfamily)
MTLTNIRPHSLVCTGVTDGALGVITAAGVASEATESRLSELFEAHHRRLYRLARRMVSTADEARDLVQDTYLRIVRAPTSVPMGGPSEEAWLVRVLVNLCRDRWRQQAAQRRFRERHAANYTGAAASSVETALIAETMVWRALRQLAPRRRAVIVLHELDGVSVTEIARLFDIAAVTVRWHLSRGRQELGRIIKDGHGL